MSGKTSRELTPAALRVLEPDLLGALALVLHGREPRPPPTSPRPPTGWRGLGRRRP